MSFSRRQHPKLKAILATLGVVVLFLALPVGFKGCNKDLLIQSQTPLWTALRDIDSLQDDAALMVMKKSELADLVKELASTQAGLELRLKTLEAVEAQKNRLESMLKMRPYYGYETRRGRVIRRDLSGYWQQLWVDVGRKQRVKVGLGVISQDGVVGRVREVFDDSCIIELVSSPRFRIAAQLSGDDRPFVYHGEGLNFGFSPIGKSEAMQPEMAVGQKDAPRTIVTTGLSLSFPEGIPIGDLVQTGDVSQGGLLVGDIKLPRSLHSLRQVTILIPNQ